MYITLGIASSRVSLAEPITSFSRTFNVVPIEKCIWKANRKNKLIQSLISSIVRTNAEVKYKTEYPSGNGSLVAFRDDWFCSDGLFVPFFFFEIRKQRTVNVVCKCRNYEFDYFSRTWLIKYLQTWRVNSVRSKMRLFATINLSNDI